MLRGKTFVSAERTKQWQSYARFHLTDKAHKLIELPHAADYITHPIMNERCWHEEDGRNKVWDLIFVDHFPDEARAPMLKFIRENGLARVVVVHDTSVEMEARMIGLKDEIAQWTHKYVYNLLRPSTTVMSMQYEINEILELGL